MPSEDFYPGEGSKQELFENLWESCSYLVGLSRGRNRLLEFIRMGLKIDEENGSCDYDVMFAKNAFLSAYGISLEALPEPKNYFLLRKYHERVLAGIRRREKENRIIEISAGVTYLEELCAKCRKEPSELIGFLDSSEYPPKIDSLFRQWAEIGGRELNIYCFERDFSTDEAISELYLDEVHREIQKKEKKLYISESE